MTETIVKAILTWLPGAFPPPLTPARQFVLDKLIALVFWIFPPPPPPVSMEFVIGPIEEQ